MNHLCPNCNKRCFSFRGIVSAGTFHGVTCPTCNTQLQLPLWARLVPGIPLIVWILWEITMRPPEIPEFYGLMASVVLGLLFVIASLLWIPLVRIK